MVAKLVVKTSCLLFFAPPIAVEETIPSAVRNFKWSQSQSAIIFYNCIFRHVFFWRYNWMGNWIYFFPVYVFYFASFLNIFFPVSFLDKRIIIFMSRKGNGMLSFIYKFLIIFFLTILRQPLWMPEGMPAEGKEAQLDFIMANLSGIALFMLFYGSSHALFFGPVSKMLSDLS